LGVAAGRGAGSCSDKMNKDEETFVLDSLAPVKALSSADLSAGVHSTPVT